MEESRPVSLRIGADAHRGLVREENQDRISRIQSPLGDVFVVADGMGGHEGGATAAQMLIDGLRAHLDGLQAGMPADAALRDAATAANADIYRHAQGGDPRFAKMGATSVLVLIDGSRAWIGHAGDSRAYLWRGGQLTRLTRDHTLVQRMLEHQILNEEEARHHPDANVVTRAFGQKPDIELEVGPPLELYDGDHLLLCSDGLSGYVDDAAIARVLSTGGDAQAMTDALIGLALQAGGEDNVSVQVIAVQDETGQGMPPPPVPVPLRAEPPPVSLRAVAPPPETPAPPPPVEETPLRAQRRGGFPMLIPLVLAAFLVGVFLPWRDWFFREPTAPLPAKPAVPGLSTSEPDATDPLAAGPELVTSPGPEELPSDTDLGTSEEIEIEASDEPPLPPQPTPEVSPKKRPLEIVVLATDRQAGKPLRGLGAVAIDKPSPLFAEGRVYYREGHEQDAEQVIRKLGTKGGRYVKDRWPETNAYFPTAGVLVAARRPAGSAAATPPAPAPGPAAPAPGESRRPRVTVLGPADAEIPQLPPAVTGAYAGNWSKPEPIEGGDSAVFEEGHVYFRPDSELLQPAKDLAEKLGYTAVTWPAGSAQKHINTDLLVILRSKPPEKPPAR